MTSQELGRLEYAAKLADKSLEQFILDAAIDEADRVLVCKPVHLINKDG